jgi:hypothetical protein
MDEEKSVHDGLSNVDEDLLEDGCSCIEPGISFIEILVEDSTFSTSFIEVQRIFARDLVTTGIFT